MPESPNRPELAVVKETAVAPKPWSLSFAEVASLLIAGGTGVAGVT